jgi:penicillin-binding protein 2
MNMVSNSPYGTAYRSRIRERKRAIAGKTGTVQVRRITKAERQKRLVKNKERLWKDRDHALFVGYAPVSSPRYAVSVVIEHGGGGASVAAPVARDVLEEVQRRDLGRAPMLDELAVDPDTPSDI